MSNKKDKIRDMNKIIVLCLIIFWILNINLIVKVTSNEERKLAIYSVETGDKLVAISFDEGWELNQTDELLKVLDKHNCKATFFLVGDWVDKYPDEVIEIYKNGHDLGNHTDTHKKLTKLKEEDIRNEIMNVHNKVKELTGEEMFLFRPPYGDYNNKIIDVASDCNYYTIKWNVDSLDWQKKGIDSIVNSVLTSKYLKEGSIILFHNNTKYTKDAVDIILTKLEEQNYKVVPISQLIKKDNYHLDATGRQIDDDSIF